MHRLLTVVVGGVVVVVVVVVVGGRCSNKVIGQATVLHYALRAKAISASLTLEERLSSTAVWLTPAGVSPKSRSQEWVWRCRAPGG